MNKELSKEKMEREKEIQQLEQTIEDLKHIKMENELIITGLKNDVEDKK